MTQDLAVEVRGLTKRYGVTQAVAGVDLRIARGETFALLGPNGAGKTTTVEILEGFRQADGGSVSVLGFDPRADAGRLRARIGIMLQEGGLYLTMTPREALRLFARFYEHARDPADLLLQVGLEEAADTRFRRLSGGQKQRLNLALALLPRPELIFLDEPTAGMDPQARRATWEIIASLKAEGVSVFLTTHYLDEAERLADRVGIMNAGRIIALDRPAALTGADSAVRLQTREPVDVALFRELPSVRAARTIADGYLIDTEDAPACLAEVTAWLQQHGILARELRVGSGTLEEVYLRLTGGESE
jgi:ABC-2 type transport system ATP-binding protein